MIVGLAFAWNALINFLVGLLVAKFLGPAEFGRFAVAWAGAVLVNTVACDWLRLSAVRFYSNRSRAEEPAVRATMEACFAAAATIVALIALTLALSGLSPNLSPQLIAFAAITGLASGLYDYRTALARARFLDRAYVRIVLIKNGLGFALTVGGAYLFSSAPIALAGACLSAGGALLTSMRALRDPGARLSEARPEWALRFLGYAAPFVLYSALLQLLPLGNRLIIGSHFGFAEAGYFSLANDIAIRILAALGSAMDVFLFQLAVRAEERDGEEAARDRLARNMTLVLLLIAPAAAGLWVAAPNLESLLAPEAYRGPFAVYFTASLPGLAAFALLMYGVAPIFQIAKRNGLLVAAGLTACAVEVAAVAIWPSLAGDGVRLALAQSGGLVAALCAAVLLATPLRPRWPRAQDLCGIVLATAAMVAATLPLRGHPPGLAPLIGEGIVGGGVYAALVLLLDVAGMRGEAGVLASSFGARLKRAG